MLIRHVPPIPSSVDLRIETDLYIEGHSPHAIKSNFNSYRLDIVYYVEYTFLMDQ